MAQSASQAMSGAANDVQNTLTRRQIHELEQYDKILRLRDAVLSGKHPTIKVAPDLLSQTQAILSKGSDRTEHAQTYSRGPALGAPYTANSISKRVAPEINPIFLEKSEHLVRAELKLQRQRAERALKDEAEQRRPVKHAPPDFSTDIDIPDVLSRALAIVPAIPAAKPAVPDATANSDNRSDSFDDNTFYSSQHETPEVHSSPTHHDAVATAEVSPARRRDADDATEDIYDPMSPGEPTAPVSAAPVHLAPAPPLAEAVNSAPRVAAVPGLNNYNAQSTPGSWSAAQPPRDSNFPPGLGTTPQHLSGFHVLPQTSVHPLATEAYAEAHPPSPLLRTHDLEPFAPQPAHHAAFNVESSASNSGPATATGTPAQVAALRHDPMSATSPDSSPQGGRRVPERKWSKKTKRKADRQAAEADAVLIKPEPRSPSPMAAPSYIRPNKRARHAHKQALGTVASYPSSSGHASAHDAVNYDSATHSGRPAGPHPTFRTTGEGQVRSSHYPPRPASSMLAARRYSGGYPDSQGRVGHPSAHSAYPPQPYGPSEHAEIMYDYVDGSEGHPRAISHHIPYENSRMSLRPESSAYVPRQPQRIYIDSTGREYIEPRRPTVRQSVAPGGYYREPEIIYERAPPRAASRYAEAGHYVEAGAPYGSATQAYPAPRRVVTQPEYVQQPFGAPYPAEYPRASMVPPDMRAAEAPGQDFLARAASVRPPLPPASPAPAEYAPPQTYGSVRGGRMETVVRGYGPGAPVVGRQTPARPYGWDYDAGPAAHPRGHAAPIPTYYTAPTGAGDDFFIEQPRGETQEVVYTDSGRDEVYR
ncbi:hypothetical protein CC79DRAFT_1367077 [Sarocladium strictum]